MYWKFDSRTPPSPFNSFSVQLKSSLQLQNSFFLNGCLVTDELTEMIPFTLVAPRKGREDYFPGKQVHASVLSGLQLPASLPGSARASRPGRKEDEDEDEDDKGKASKQREEGDESEEEREGS
jgi:hypothetical protein